MLRKEWLLSAFLLTLGAAGCTDAPTAAPSGPAKDAAPPQQFAHPWVGVNVGIPTPADRDTILNFAAGGNVGYVRATIYWYEMQPDGPSFAPGRLEDVQDYARKAHARGLKVLLNLEGSPAWVRLCDANNLTPEGQSCGNAWSPPHDAMYIWWQRYVADLVSALPEVDYWGVWNEPNEPRFFSVAPGRDAAGEYGKLVAYAADAVHAVPGKNVVAPDLANRDGQRDFLARVMQNVGGYIDIVSVHSYQPVSGTISMLRDYRSIGFTQPMWITEFSLWEGIGSQDDQYPQAANVSGMIKEIYYGQLDAQNVFPFHLYHSDQGYQMLTQLGPQNYRPRWAYDCMRALASNNWNNLPWYCSEHPSF